MYGVFVDLTEKRDKDPERRKTQQKKLKNIRQRSMEIKVRKQKKQIKRTTSTTEIILIYTNTHTWTDLTHTHKQMRCSLLHVFTWFCSCFCYAFVVASLFYLLIFIHRIEIFLYMRFLYGRKNRTTPEQHEAMWIGFSGVVGYQFVEFREFSSISLVFGNLLVFFRPILLFLFFSLVFSPFFRSSILVPLHFVATTYTQKKTSFVTFNFQKPRILYVFKPHCYYGHK